VAYPTGPNTTGVVDKLVAMLTDLKLADGVTPAYTTVKRGAIRNFLDLTPVAQILARDDDSARHAHGGTIVDHTTIEIRTVVDDQDGDAAEAQIFGIRDVLMPLLQKYVTLMNQPGVYHTELKPGGGFNWLYLPPSQWYRCHSVKLEVAQYYIIQGGIQS
jgi:hypothetical protein